MPYKNPEQLRAYQREWVARRRLEFFDGKSCEWCSSTADLELHHRDPAAKVSHRIWTWSEERRERETSKCIVVCHGCHTGAHREAWAVEAQLRNPCGTIQAYRRGCRCDACKTARREHAREERAAQTDGLRFELRSRGEAANALAGRPLRPLEHPSTFESSPFPALLGSEPSFDAIKDEQTDGSRSAGEP